MHLVATGGQVLGEGQARGVGQRCWGCAGGGGGQVPGLSLVKSQSLNKPTVSWQVQQFEHPAGRPGEARS